MLSNSPVYQRLVDEVLAVFPEDRNLVSGQPLIEITAFPHNKVVRVCVCVRACVRACVRVLYL